MNTFFEEGELVLVKSNLGHDTEVCCYGVVPDMKQFCGEIVKILRVVELEADDPYVNKTTGRYYIEGDPDQWIWCDNCFEKLQPEIADVNLDVSELL